MAFAAVTILMDTLHQHFLQSTPSFPLRNKTKAKSLYKNLSSLQTSLEQDFKVGEYDEAIKGLEAQIRDASVELRFRIEHHLRLFYLGKSMKVRLHSAQNLLPILNRAIEDIETMDFDSVLDILAKHFTLPVSGMPPHINKRIKSFCSHYPFLFEKKNTIYYEQEKVDEQETDNEQESKNEQEVNDEQESKNEQEDGGEQESNYEQEVSDERDSNNEQEVNDEQERNYEQEDGGEQESNYEQEVNDQQESKNEQEVGDEQEGKDEQEYEDEQESNDEQESEYEQENDEWVTEEEEKSDDRRGSEDEKEINDEERRYILCEEAESIITQELRASYLNKYMKQRIEARQRFRQIFIEGIELTSYFKKELLKAKNNTASPTRPERHNTKVGDLSQHTSKPAIKMVGCDDEFNMIMDKLNQQSSKREIVSIVGMGGIGKTTLARRIYEDASFVSRFDCQAWVTISQEYNPRQVFQDLLQALAPRKDEIHEALPSNYEMVEQVYRHLKHQRYLIVVDDIWSTNVWDDLMKCFQDDNNGSRILLTTRQKNVADYAGSASNSCHHKHFLGSDESWNLFCHKVLSKRTIVPPKFETIAREIVENCEGLPLAITVAAGLLSNSKQNLNEWELIAENVLTLCLDHSNQQCENIIHLSYTLLPHHLKFCFLSLGCFPKTYEVDEDMIVDFWVSEGFLKVLRSKSLEDAAREYLQDLVDRNLVQICGGRNGEFAKVYQLHDVLHELALGEARKENLLCFNKGSDIGLGCRRICRYNSFTHTSNTSSFIDKYKYKNLHTHYKFLRALVCKFTDVRKIFLEIMGLVHLRWLKIRTELNFHFLPLFMLGNLQKLEVYGYSSCEPLDIWGLPQLKNLSVPQSAVTLVPPRSVHHNLECIKFLDYRSCIRELFLRIPNLKVLGVGTDSKINPKCKAPDWFESLVYLYKLEELVVHEKLLRREFRIIHSMGMLSLESILPNLKKMVLFRTRLRWKDMDVVGTLSKLEVLILEFGAVDGKKWEPRDGGFHRLKFLDIGSCDLQCWEATSDHFPVLECLVLRCTKLKEIPSNFADITTLKSIKLCEDFTDITTLISSAEHIQEEQREYGNDEFEVDVFRSPNACIIA